ncbi:MAG: hypothetical protein ACI82H_000407 [Alphaproteobacteria bacterium]|jgi:hypothetical protein
MARKPNYNFEKRQRELQKKEKKAARAEAKRQQVEERKEGTPPESGATILPDGAPNAAPDDSTI